MKRFGISELLAWFLYSAGAFFSLGFLMLTLNILELLGFAVLVLALIPPGIGIALFLSTLYNLGNYKRGNSHRNAYRAGSMILAVFIVIVLILGLIVHTPTVLMAFTWILYELSIAMVIYHLVSR